MNYNKFISKVNVPRETFELLESYYSLLTKWNQSINLVGNTADIWNRHIIDSAQLRNYLEIDDHILDIGTGAGLPGLILSIMGHKVTMVDSDTRKIAFVNYVIASLKLNAKAICSRIEDLNEQEYDVVTSRALADTKTLISITRKLHIRKKHLLLKGENYQPELEGLKHIAHNSLTNPNARVIELFL